jgi:hypothetical protein
VTSHVSITSIVASQRQARINRQAVDRARIARMMHEAATSERKGAVMDAVIERALAHGRA